MINVNKGLCEAKGSTYELMMDLTVIIHSLDRGLSENMGQDAAKKCIDAAIDAAFENRNFPTDDEIFENLKADKADKKTIEDDLCETLKRVEELADKLLKEANNGSTK